MENRYLNPDALKELVHRVITGIDREAEEDREALESILPSFHAYVDAVAAGEMKMMLSGSYATDGQPFRELVSDYDRNRHSRHETAITNVKVLNRLAELYEISPVFTGNSAERHQVADFCMELDCWLFENRRMKLS